MPIQNGKHPTESSLQAYADNQLEARRQEAVRAHLSHCEICRARLHALQNQRARISQTLSLLEPTYESQPDKQRTLATLRTQINRRQDTMSNNKRLLRGLGAAAALAVVASLFLFEPVRALASEFLGLFRVEQFTVIDVDADRAEEIAEVVDATLYFGAETIIEEYGEPISVDSLDEAASLVGFTPLAPAGHPAPDEIFVTTSGQISYTPDVDVLREILVMLGLDPDLVPEEIDGQPFTLDVPEGVLMTFGDGDPDVQQDITVMQLQSPSAEVPEGVDIQQLGELLLQILGMTEEEAARVSASIDWTTTLIVPMPSGLINIHEVVINGTSGLYLEPTDDDTDGSPDGGALVWQKDGIIYMVSGGDSYNSLLELANSLQ